MHRGYILGNLWVYGRNLGKRSCLGLNLRNCLGCFCNVLGRFIIILRQMIGGGWWRHCHHLISNAVRLLFVFIIRLTDAEFGLRTGGAEDAADLRLLCQLYGPQRVVDI